MEVIALFLILVVVPWFILNHQRAYKIWLGVVLMLGAFPLGVATEIGLNGCCGAPHSHISGIGYLLMAALFLGGLVLAISVIRSKRPGR
jgi:hypothetical protein